MKQTVLITGARAPIALELARSFNDAGHIVIMADCLHLTIARWSNTIRKYYSIASPRYENSKFVSDIQKIIQIENVTHFIPTCEETIFVSEHIDKFNCKVWTSEMSLILKLHNKFSFTQFTSPQFRIPETQLLSDFSDWSHSDAYVFKPCYSRFASSVIINKKIDEGYFSENEKGKWIAQRKINGIEICVYSVWDNGIMKAYAAYHPLYRAGKGAGVFFEPVHNEDVFKQVKSFGEQIQYTGQLCFDVIVDQYNTPYFIECNPRGTSGAHLLHEKLADIFLTEGLCKMDESKEYAIKQILFLFHFLASFTKRVRKSKDIIFRWNDMKPYFLQPLSMFELGIVKFKKGVSWLAATTENIEWNGHEN